jgi:hypothetical protein
MMSAAATTAARTGQHNALCKGNVFSDSAVWHDAFVGMHSEGPYSCSSTAILGAGCSAGASALSHHSGMTLRLPILSVSAVRWFSNPTSQVPSPET